MGPILILAVTFGLMYVLFILPQKKRMAAHRDLLKRVDVGDEVMLTSGFYGTVLEVDEDEDVLWLELAEGVEVKVARGAIGKRTVLAADRPIDDAAADDDDVDLPDELDAGSAAPGTTPGIGDVPDTEAPRGTLPADPDTPEPR